MQDNAYILERTMNNYADFKSKLKQEGLAVKELQDDEDITVTVTQAKISNFIQIVQKHLNKPFNYVDIKFPDKKLTVIVFQDRIWEIDGAKINKEAQEWAISIGLPEKEADWPTFY